MIHNTRRGKGEWSRDALKPEHTLRIIEVFEDGRCWSKKFSFGLPSQQGSESVFESRKRCDSWEAGVEKGSNWILAESGGIWRIVGSHWSFRLFPFSRRPEESLAATYQTNWLTLNDALVDVPRQIWHEDFKRPQGPQGFSVLLSDSPKPQRQRYCNSCVTGCNRHIASYCSLHCFSQAEWVLALRT